jgi:hypothetical protein
MGGELKNAYKVSSLGRTLDPDYPSNRAVLILVPILAAAAAILAWLIGVPTLAGLLRGIRVGLAAFVSWALTREIDPDHNGSAFLAMALGTVAIVVYPDTDILVAFWLLAVLRVLNRTTGLPARWLDSVVVAGFSIWMLWTYDFILGLIAGLVFILDSAFYEPLPRHRYFGFGLIVLGVVRGLAGIEGQVQHILDINVLWALIPALLFIPLLLHSSKVESLCDVTDQLVNSRRVQASQIVAILTALILVERAIAGVESAGLVLASLLGAGVFFIGFSVWKRRSSA